MYHRNSKLLLLRHEIREEGSFGLLRVHHLSRVAEVVEVPCRHQPVAPVVPRATHQQHAAGRRSQRHHSARAAQPSELHQLIDRETWLLHKVHIDLDRVSLIQQRHAAMQHASRGARHRGKATPAHRSRSNLGANRSEAMQRRRQRPHARVTSSTTGTRRGSGTDLADHVPRPGAWQSLRQCGRSGRQ